MFRLFFMIAIAFVLWPINENNERLGVEGMEISSADLFSAGTAVMSDVWSFCERNVETCVTGEKIITTAASEFKSQVSQFSGNQPQSSE